MVMNRTFNANVSVGPIEQLSLMGKVCAITKRWGAVANGATVTALFDVRSDWFSFEFNINPTGTFWFDVWLVSSYSGGTDPKIGNRNFLFQGVNSFSTLIKIDPVVEVQVSSVALVERIIAGGAGPKSAGGSFGQENLIQTLPGTKFLWEFTNKSGSVQDIDFQCLAFDGMVNSTDWTGQLNVP